LKRLVIQPEKPWPLNGLTIKRWAVALVAVLRGLGSLEIFSSALARPSGYLVRSAPEASAKNSLFREIESWIRLATIGARIARIIAIMKKIPCARLLSLSLLRNPPHQSCRIKI